MDGEQAWVERAPLVFAADQRPFPVGPNRFCVLQPLMTLDGKRLSADADNFPNRGRVWWMLRDDIRDEVVVPGSLWAGRIEHSTRVQPERSTFDQFQAFVPDIHPAGADLIEALPLAEGEPDLLWVQRETPISWPRPTTSKVILLGQESVLGPLQATWEPRTHELSLAALSKGQPEVLRLPIKEFLRIARTEEFLVTLCEYDNYAEMQQQRILLTKTSWLNLERLRKAAEVLDASTDAQFLNWAVKHLRFTRSQVAPLKQFLAEMARDQSPLGDDNLAGKRARFQRIAADAERVVNLGEEVAHTLADTPAFAELIRKHVDALASRRIEEAVRLRKDEIEAALQTNRRALQQVQDEIKQLSAEYDRKAASMEEELRKRLAARLEALEERERQLARREKNVAEQEANLLGRLERVTERYRSEADRVGDELLAQIPLLRKLGLGGSDGNTPLTPTSGPPTAFAELVLPSFLSESKNAREGGSVSESDFLAQFTQVVEQKGFNFAHEDLINFHVCVKTGGLTILAGLSGTGKSTLPRLYAEALGCKEEYLHVSVRPDWLDDRDLVGAFNALAQRFEPASSGLVEHLVAASLDRQKSRGGIYLICLDEMNLARVEHYFAQFLSVLELPAEDRLLTLFAPGLVKSVDPYAPYQQIHLGENLRFLGTVNIDETTHFFSPKVLDRCQVVAFGAPDLATARRSRMVEKVRGIRPVPLATYLDWVRPPQEQGQAREFLLHINDILRQSRLGLGFRQFDRILRYVHSARPFFREDVALDYQLKQVVWPRLRNTAPQFGQTLQALTTAVPRDRFPRSAEILARILEARTEDDYFQLL
jgi:hypothetical protein